MAEIHEEIDTEVFQSYTCSSDNVPGCEHPAAIAESGLLAAVQLPDLHYPVESYERAKVIAENKLSKLQMEAILHANQRHLGILPNGHRCAAHRATLSRSHQPLLMRIFRCLF